MNAIRHGMTGRWCYHCQAQTTHLIVESLDTHVKAYICLRHNELEREDGNERDAISLPHLPTVHGHI